MSQPPAVAPVPADPNTVKSCLQSFAREEGFPLIRFAAAGPQVLPREIAKAALAAGYLADMRWMDEDWIDRATDTSAFLAGARTVMVLALPYGVPEPEPPPGGPPRGRIARYAEGRDYHRIFEPPLRRVVRRIRDELHGSARATVDYGPLLERPWAAFSGLGWLGKSSMLLVPGFGPWVMLGVVVTNLEVEPDESLKKTCGSCDRCITACPTGAISPDGHVVDSRRCISYHTIENRGPVPRELRSKFGDWVFGCDECLTSCPVGRHANGSPPDFVSKSVDDARPSLASLLELDDDSFAERYRGRAIMRAKRDGLARNACIALGNTGGPDDLPSLFAALGDRAALVRGHAAWAVAEIALRTLSSPAGRDAARAPLVEALPGENDAWVREEIGLALERIAGDESAPRR